MAYAELTTTIQTRLERDTVASHGAALDAYAALTGQACAVYAARRSRGEMVNKPAFMAELGLNARQFNAIQRHVDGLAASQASNRKNYIADDQARLADNDDRISTLLDKQTRALEQGNDMRVAALQRQLSRKIAYGHRINERLAQRQAADAAGTISLCLGGRQLFNQQYHLAANGYDSHAAWLADWRDARSRQIFITGAKGEPWGCRNAQLRPTGADTFDLVLALPPALQGKFGKTITLTNLTFPRAEARQWLAAVLAEHNNRAYQQGLYRALCRAGKTPNKGGPKPVSLDNFCSDSGQALSFRLIRDTKGWRVLVTFTQRRAEQVSAADQHAGVVSLDINAGFISLVELDANGDPVTAFDVLLPREVDTGALVGSRPYLTALHEAAKLICDHARRVGKPLVLERLDFAAKKQVMRDQPPQRNRRLSSFGYQRIGEAIMRRAAWDGIAVSRVNPAWTSVIGRFLPVEETGGSVHTGAAIAVGRRQLGRSQDLSEKPIDGLWHPIRGVACWFEMPEDIDSWPALNACFKNWLREQIRLRRDATRDWRAGLKAGNRRQIRADIPC